jgi:hypothetical protein
LARNNSDVSAALLTFGTGTALAAIRTAAAFARTSAAAATMATPTLVTAAAAAAMFATVTAFARAARRLLAGAFGGLTFGTRTALAGAVAFALMLAAAFAVAMPSAAAAVAATALAVGTAVVLAAAFAAARFAAAARALRPLAGARGQGIGRLGAKETFQPAEEAARARGLRSGPGGGFRAAKIAARFAGMATAFAAVPFRTLTLGTRTLRTGAFRTSTLGTRIRGAETFRAAAFGTAAFRTRAGRAVAFAAAGIVPAFTPFAAFPALAGTLGVGAENRAVVTAFPARGGPFGFGGREDVQLGLDRSGFIDGGSRLFHDRLGSRGGNGFRGDIFAARRNRRGSDFRNRHGGRGGSLDRSGGNVRGGRSGHGVLTPERVLVFALRSDKLQSGGLVLAGGGDRSGGCRRGRGALAARQAGTTLGAERAERAGIGLGGRGLVRLGGIAGRDLVCHFVFFLGSGPTEDTGAAWFM